MSVTDLSEFYDTFFDEAEELLQGMEETLLGLDIANPDKESLNAIFRAAHSIKGGAATFGAFDTLVQTTHKLENVLDRVRNAELAITNEGLDVFLLAKDVLCNQVAAYRAQQDPDVEAAQMLLEALQHMSEEDQDVVDLAPIHAAPPAPQEASSKSTQSGAGTRMSVSFLGVSTKDLETLRDELAMMGDLEVGPASEKSSQFFLTTELDADSVLAVCGFVINDDQMRIEAAPAVASPKPSAAAGSTSPSPQIAKSPAGTPAKGPAKDSGTIRVPTHRVDVLVNQVGEVVINQSILAQACTKLDPIEHATLLEGFEHMAGALRSLQESIMALRMVPMDYAFGRYPRVVRETAAKLNKQIELKTIGGATELDKGLIERMIDPLTHLIRNSLDHGIETPEKRIAKGKNPAGTITISAYHEGGRIVIEVTDDGGGLNRDKIIAKAMERGLPASPAMSDSDAFQLIFQPGFSTADTVTDVSGRGVGMDVVRRNIEEVGGLIQIKSELDKGTTILISLPLTLAIMDGMSIQVGNERFVMPLSHIVECLQPGREQVHALAHSSNVLTLRGDHLPVVRLADIFSIEGAEKDLFKAILVVVKVGNDRYALVVDQLLGQHQVVVKSLETHYERVQGLSGATILGDGSVALILDAARLNPAA